MNQNIQNTSWFLSPIYFWNEIILIFMEHAALGCLQERFSFRNTQNKVGKTLNIWQYTTLEFVLTITPITSFKSFFNLWFIQLPCLEHTLNLNCTKDVHVRKQVLRRCLRSLQLNNATITIFFSSEYIKPSWHASSHRFFAHKLAKHKIWISPHLNKTHL